MQYKKKPDISVIVPVFNVELYLNQCLESICNQTLKNIEIIIINDGSTDSSGRIISSFSDRDNRIISITQKNSGYGAAVNRGLEASSGEYISIIESDDWIDAGMLECLLCEAEDSKYNIIKSSFRKILASDETIEVLLSEIVKHDGKIIDASSSTSLMTYESSIWSAIYLKSALKAHNIKMLETNGAAYQDVVWKFMCYSSLGPIKIVDKSFYNYRVLANGSSSRSGKNHQAHFKNYSEIERYLVQNQHWERLSEAFYIHQFFDFIFHIRRLSKLERKEFKKKAVTVISNSKKMGFDPYKIKVPADRKEYYTKALSLISLIEAESAIKEKRVLYAFQKLVQCILLKIKSLSILKK